ncbi:zinc-binding dehydrogenase [Pseudonocardia kunmingensis]|uniref:zinc-binding dehydrogenase n=1 Tax=Pseudonocardia kunmingensis TaxID=630975 RepID=UPI0011529396|nr:zinc-binding dehydrogenase [Pseudonocardia kunmingensis]
MTSARVVAVDSGELGRELAAKVGAEVVLDADHAIEGVTDLTGGDVVIDFVGEQNTPEQATRMLRQGGTYFVVGYGAQLTTPTVELVSKEISVVGNLVGSYADLDDLMKLVARGRVTLETQRYPLDQALRALDDLAEGRVRGRAVLTP